METLSDVVDKRFGKSLLHFLKLVDPERKFGFDTPLVEAWNALTLTEQRQMYLYLLYKKRERSTKLRKTELAARSLFTKRQALVQELFKTGQCRSKAEAWKIAKEQIPNDAQ